MPGTAGRLAPELVDDLAGIRKSFRIEANALDPSDDEGNVSLDLTPQAPRGRDHRLELSAWFSLDGMELLGGLDERNNRYAQLLKEDWDVVQLSLTRRLLEPFKYKSNLLGRSAEEFMARRYGTWRLSLGRIHGELFLAAS